jgi:hypothetical protein
MMNHEETRRSFLNPINEQDFWLLNSRSLYPRRHSLLVSMRYICNVPKPDDSLVFQKINHHTPNTVSRFYIPHY